MNEIEETLKMYRPWIEEISKAIEKSGRALSALDICTMRDAGTLELPFLGYREGALVLGVFDREELEDVLTFATDQGLFRKETLSGRDFYRVNVV